MMKLIGTIRIQPNPGSDTMGPHFEIDFLPYHGRLNTQTVRARTRDDLVEFLIRTKISEDEAYRTMQRQSQQMRKSMQEISQSIILNDEMKRNPEYPLMDG